MHPLFQRILAPFAPPTSTPSAEQAKVDPAQCPACQQPRGEHSAACPYRPVSEAAQAPKGWCRIDLDCPE